MDSTPVNTERAQLYADMAPHHLRPLWEVLHALVPPHPMSPCQAAHWSYDTTRPFLMRAGQAITAHEAVRRVLILENPALPGQSAVTQSLYAGLQLILPGEVAPSHRHTQSALRFIVEGSGAFTAVDGERTIMEEGDFIITPSWTWHDHGNDSAKPIVWMDGLDIPMIRFFDAGFAENGSAAQQAVTKTAGASYAAYGHNMVPVVSTKSTNSYQHTSPIFNYPYARSREALATLAKSEVVDPHLGYMLKYVNPVTGRAAMATIGTALQMLPAGFAGKPHRRTDGTIYSVVEGEVKVTVSFGDQSKTFTAKKRDQFVVPSWHSLSMSAAKDAVLFSFSDLPVQEALGIHRSEFL